MRLTSQTSHRIATAGFTLIEVLIIAPVVILAISGFVALMVTMTAEVLVTRDNNNMTYETQDALDRIEQDVRLSTQFLVTSGAFTTPQGSNNNFTGTAAFTATTGSLILGGLTTDKNPADSTRQLVYYAGQPNLCGAQQSYNRVFLSKVMYFLKDGDLWRRAVLPNYNTNPVLDDDTVCSAPWQRNTCSPGYSLATRCQTNDTMLMENVDSFNIKYFSNPNSTVDIGPSQALAATTIEVTLTGKKTTAGRDITSSGSMRATKLNNIDVDIPIPGTPAVTGQVVNGSSIVFSWAKVPLASSYVISYNINGGAWINATNNSQTATYTVSATRKDTVTIRVSARNSSGTSPYNEAATTIPAWNTCGLQNGWENYGFTYATSGYTKTNDDVVMLKGLIKSPNPAVSGTVLCTLPVGYRPSHRLLFQVATNANAPGRIDVLTNGDVVLIVGNSGWLGLDNINFVASGAPYAWTDLTGVNGWVNYGGDYSPLRSTKDANGRTHVQGLIKSGTYTNPTPVTTLPVAHRPAQYTHFVAGSNSAFNYTAVGASIDAKGINGSGWYSIQAMFFAAGYGGWTNLSLQNGWVSFDGGGHSTPQYTKSADGIVTVKGLIKSGTATAGTLIANLPVGYRPNERLLMHCVAWGVYCRVDVLANGNIVTDVVNSGWTSIEFSFPADQ